MCKYLFELLQLHFPVLTVSQGGANTTPKTKMVALEEQTLLQRIVFSCQRMLKSGVSVHPRPRQISGLVEKPHSLYTITPKIPIVCRNIQRTLLPLTRELFPQAPHHHSEREVRGQQMGRQRNKSFKKRKKELRPRRKLEVGGRNQSRRVRNGHC